MLVCYYIRIHMYVCTYVCMNRSTEIVRSLVFDTSCIACCKYFWIKYQISYIYIWMYVCVLLKYEIIYSVSSELHITY